MELEKMFSPGNFIFVFFRNSVEPTWVEVLRFVPEIKSYEIKYGPHKYFFGKNEVNVWNGN
jgi:hypothetical protein